MSGSDEVAARLTRQLDRAAELRAAAAANPKLEAARQGLRAWQAARLARTHADLLAGPGTGRAAAFFLSDLYGSEDLTQLDAGVKRIVPTMRRLLPPASLETLAEAVELETLSEELDFAMATALGARPGGLSAAAYGDAYRAVGRRADRERQIRLIEDTGHSLDHLVHQPLFGAALSMMRWPAHVAGLGELHDFLHRGYQAFHHMGGAAEFLATIAARERRLLAALFSGDDGLLA
jgi:hypothetical protein